MKEGEVYVIFHLVRDSIMDIKLAKQLVNFNKPRKHRLVHKYLDDAINRLSGLMNDEGNGVDD